MTLMIASTLGRIGALGNALSIFSIKGGILSYRRTAGGGVVTCVTTARMFVFVLDFVVVLFVFMWSLELKGQFVVCAFVRCFLVPIDDNCNRQFGYSSSRFRESGMFFAALRVERVICQGSRHYQGSACVRCSTGPFDKFGEIERWFYEGRGRVDLMFFVEAIWGVEGIFYGIVSAPRLFLHVVQVSTGDAAHGVCRHFSGR